MTTQQAAGRDTGLVQDGPGSAGILPALASDGGPAGSRRSQGHDGGPAESRWSQDSATSTDAPQALGHDADDFVRGRAPFLRYLAERAAARQPARLEEIVAAAGGPDNVAIVAVDVVNGFCKSGALASPRVGAIVPPIVEVLRRAHDAGVRRVALVCDTHVPDAVEFGQFAPHCVAGTEESEPVDELKQLPFYDEMYVVRKNSISPWHSEADLAGWLRGAGQGVTTVIAVGDCTDLCLHQLALPLKLSANQENRPLRVVAPVDCIQTYDLAVDVAAALGAMPHDGDLLHEVFLYHLELNGVEVVSRLDA